MNNFCSRCRLSCCLDLGEKERRMRWFQSLGAAATQLLAVHAAVIVFATLSLGHVAVTVACLSWS
jgi:hypothetical protein